MYHRTEAGLEGGAVYTVMKQAKDWLKDKERDNDDPDDRMV